ncbi:hypothetical protein BS47DRAFT_1369056 [Hydnum rufescens UP504]|uniref:Uncharacterized protein n=1 Tax=Hydnum rufescens UP504 TaxID=1448309 RepID=A0A9P6AE43_9AGAM|nr:hypothetical protein BS47DRAFT_1369056 [Hydnum rufescens UP504]
MVLTGLTREGAKFVSAIAALVICFCDPPLHQETESQVLGNCLLANRWVHLPPFQKSQFACDLARFTPFQKIQSANIQTADWLVQDAVALLYMATGGSLQFQSSDVSPLRDVHTPASFIGQVSGQSPLDGSDATSQPPLGPDVPEDNRGLCSEADALGDGPLLMEETACFPLLDSLSDSWFAQHSESDEHLLPTSVGNPGTSISATSRSVLPASPDRAKWRKLWSQEAAKQYRQRPEIWERNKARSWRRQGHRVKESVVVVSATSGMQDLWPSQSGLTGSTKVTKSMEDALLQSQLSATLEQLRPVEYNPAMDTEWMEHFVRIIDCFISQTKVKERPHARGRYWSCNIGFNHASGNNSADPPRGPVSNSLCSGPQMPFMTKFHESHQEPVEELLNTKEWQLIESLLTNMMDTYFPAIAKKYRCCDEYWRGCTNGVIKAISSLFFLVSINASLSEHVKTWPHRNRKNVAIGICTIFIFGFFDDTEQAWLVNLEANIVVQLPTGDSVPTV